MRIRQSCWVAVLALTTALVGASVASASGGTFDVVNCSSLNRAYGGTIQSTTNAFTARSLCSDPDNEFAFKIDSVDRAAEGRSASVHWDVAPPLGIVGVSSEARLRSTDGFESSLYMADELGRFTESVGTGGHGLTGFKTYDWHGKPQRRFVARLECGERPNCAASDQARTWVRNLRFTVADYEDPTVEVDGSLFASGWVRGSAEVVVQGEDEGSGLSQIQVEANSQSLVSQSQPCDGALSDRISRSFSPCLRAGALNSSADTTDMPFSNGPNDIRLCMLDFAGNRTCESRGIKIDNEAPTLSFETGSNDDPELVAVRVLEQFSGIKTGRIEIRPSGDQDWEALTTQMGAGRLTARVDSSAYPPGTYEFRAIATDFAGNNAESTVRDDGTPMTLDFPLKSGVELSAEIEPGGSRNTTIAYGHHAMAKGRLFDAAGEPLSGQVVTIDEDFGEGALIDHRVRNVATDAEGRWSSKLPAGPSRSVIATYAGDQRYLSDDADAGTLSVRTGASLGISRKHVPEGSSTTFRGRIGRLGAHIPEGGKLVQLQYQDPTTGRWSTVRNAFHTRSNGKYRFKYSFGTHYIVDVAIRFRLQVPAERDWPYRGAKTKSRRVIVEAR